MIKLSCSSTCLRGRSLGEALYAHAAIGFRRLELIALGAGTVDLQEWDPPDLGALLAEHGQELVALYCPPVDVRCLMHLSESVARVQRAIECAAALGCPRIVFPPLRPREGYDYAALARACGRLCEDIGDRDVAIALENHHGWPLSYPEDYERLFADVDDPRLGITVDTGHFSASEVDIPAFVDRFADRIYHVHLKDIGKWRSVPFGEGDVDNVGTIERLRANGYEGCASVEIEMRDREGPERDLAQAFAYCRDVLGLEC